MKGNINQKENDMYDQKQLTFLEYIVRKLGLRTLTLTGHNEEGESGETVGKLLNDLV